MKGAAYAGLRLDPDGSAMVLDDSATNGKSNSSSGIVVCIVEPLKHFEDAIGVSRIDADAIVADRDQPRAVRSFGANAHAWRLSGAILDRIAHEVAQYLHELRRIA